MQPWGIMLIFACIVLASCAPQNVDVPALEFNSIADANPANMAIENSTMNESNATLEDNRTTESITVYMKYPPPEERYLLGFYSGGGVPEPRQGEDAIAYFKSRNLSGNYTYVLVQFISGKPSEPTSAQEKELNRDGIIVGGPHGNAAYARFPNWVLTSKSYPFIRWIGILEPEQKIVGEGLRAYLKRNCTGPVKLEVSLFELFTIEDLSLLKAKDVHQFGSWESEATLTIDIANLGTMAQLNKVYAVYAPSTAGVDKVLRAQAPPWDLNVTCQD